MGLTNIMNKTSQHQHLISKKVRTYKKVRTHKRLEHIRKFKIDVKGDTINHYEP